MENNKIFLILEKYNIIPMEADLIPDATGIGDILFRLLCIKYKLITKPFFFCLNYFLKPYYSSDPIPHLEFRINLINEILDSNEISKDKVIYFFTNSKDYATNQFLNNSKNYDTNQFLNNSNNYVINLYLPYKAVFNYSLNLKIDNDYEEDDYIIFHTKCRHTNQMNYLLLKKNIKLFCEIFKSKYKIIIMGERVFPITEEVIVHGITTVYDEFLGLKNNNNVIDLTCENIYNNLNYEMYKNDIKIIKKAKYNICFGIGGQFCSSLVFGKSTILYCMNNIFNLNKYFFEKNDNYQTENINYFFNFIENKCGIKNQVCYDLKNNNLKNNNLKNNNLKNNNLKNNNLKNKKPRLLLTFN